MTDLSPVPGHISIAAPWMSHLPIQQQGVLMLATRGPDGMRKHHPAKDLIRAYRATVMTGARIGRVYEPGEGGDTFMSAHLLGEHAKTPWVEAVEAYFDHIDEIPHHYHLHFMHGAQIIGYKHPDETVAKRWLFFYDRCVEDMHLAVEIESVMDDRLDDFGMHPGGHQ